MSGTGHIVRALVISRARGRRSREVTAARYQPIGRAGRARPGCRSRRAQRAPAIPDASAERPTDGGAHDNVRSSGLEVAPVVVRCHASDDLTRGRPGPTLGTGSSPALRPFASGVTHPSDGPPGSWVAPAAGRPRAAAGSGGGVPALRRERAATTSRPARCGAGRGRGPPERHREHDAVVVRNTTAAVSSR